MALICHAMRRVMCVEYRLWKGLKCAMCAQVNFQWAHFNVD